MAVELRKCRRRRRPSLRTRLKLREAAKRRARCPDCGKFVPQLGAARGVCVECDPWGRR